MDTKINTFLKEANEARESGDLEKSLHLFTNALLQAARENNLGDFCESIAGRSITLRHLAENSDSHLFLILAENELLAAIKIAERHNLKEALAFPYFQLGNALEHLGKLDEAVKAYAQALGYLENNPTKSHESSAVKADFKIHLYTCKYKAGDKTALEKALEALEELEGASEDEYSKKVWLSGAHMRIAEMLKDDDLPKAKHYLGLAKKIIDSDGRLILRNGQWERLSVNFSP